MWENNYATKQREERPTAPPLLAGGRQGGGRQRLATETQSIAKHFIVTISVVNSR